MHDRWSCSHHSCYHLQYFVIQKGRVHLICIKLQHAQLWQFMCVFFTNWSWLVCYLVLRRNGVGQVGYLGGRLHISWRATEHPQEEKAGDSWVLQGESGKKELWEGGAHHKFSKKDWCEEQKNSCTFRLAAPVTWY